MSEVKTWWILFRRWETVVMETRDAILRAYPEPENPEINLIKTVEYSAYEQLKETAEKYSRDVDNLLQERIQLTSDRDGWKAKAEGWFCVGCQKFVKDVGRE